MHHTLSRKQLLRTDIKRAWDFFSDPQNLKKITPPYMNFEITSSTGNETYAGQMISYKVNISPLTRISWLTEITHFKAPSYFVDEQRIGPYRLWHHQHFFRQKGDGVEIEDLVTYRLPFGVFGRLLHALFIKRQLQEIFDYRGRAIEQIFNERHGPIDPARKSEQDVHHV